MLWSARLRVTAGGDRSLASRLAIASDIASAAATELGGRLARRTEPFALSATTTLSLSSDTGPVVD
jgi:hypothetical protein